MGRKTYMLGLPGASAWSTPPKQVRSNDEIAMWLRDLAGQALAMADLIDPLQWRPTPIGAGGSPGPAPMQPMGTESAPKGQTNG